MTMQTLIQQILNRASQAHTHTYTHTHTQPQLRAIPGRLLPQHAWAGRQGTGAITRRLLHAAGALSHVKRLVLGCCPPHKLVQAGIRALVALVCTTAQWGNSNECMGECVELRYTTIPRGRCKRTTAVPMLGCIHPSTIAGCAPGRGNMGCGGGGAVAASAATGLAASCTIARTCAQDGAHMWNTVGHSCCMLIDPVRTSGLQPPSLPAPTAQQPGAPRSAHLAMAGWPGSPAR